MSGLTTNHEYEHRAHKSHMATEKAPGPPILPRRRKWRRALTQVSLTLFQWLLIGITAAFLVVLAAFGLALIGFVLTGEWPRF